MGMIAFIIGCLSILIIISWAWVSAIDDMMKNHPDYKGEDLMD